ncbi:MAG: BamA/TamA family outer membrane protein [Bacteroidales bacterium]|nr:BamA/TamA family outer membrane protein [Bacteroidales bacterium]
MKKILFASLAFFASASMVLAFAQDESKKEEKEMKKGWSFGVLPTATYSVDNGFQAGLFGDVYYYGDGSTYPDPVHKISWEGSYFTHSHRMRLYLAYDSKYLIPKMRVNASVTYVTDPLYSFWGFNGPAAMQNYDVWSSRKLTVPSAADPTVLNNVNYYGMSRDMLRVLANVQGQIVPHLNWAAGVNFWHWKAGAMRDNGVKDGDVKRYYNTDLTLFETYKTLGIIHEDEANGGNALEINAGVVYDTRDMEAAPNKGIWAEAYLNGNVLQHQYLKACVYFRHYIDIPIHIPAGDPVFAYRLAWQQTIAGETPLYMIQNVPLLVQRNMISEGFGSSNTIRGIRENRILTEGFAWANTELRIKLVKFKLFNQYFYIAVNPFFDAGIITKPFRAAEFEKVAVEGKVYDPKLAAIGQETLIYDSSKIRDVIMSAGAGLKIAMNQNFIVSAEFAKCLYKPLDAGLWIGIGINYQF